MNEFEGLLSSPWVQATGWTLLHSLWQSVLVSIVVTVAMRCIPSRYSTPRYVVATAGLASILLLSTGTFFYIHSGITPGAHQTIGSFYHQTSDAVINADLSSFSVLSGQVNVFIQGNLGVIVLFWSIGALLCSLRVLSGWWYIQRLRREAVLLGENWSNRVQTLSTALHIRQFIPLAESSRIHAPVVIGYLKPIILFPVGMCSGLSAEQLESIILHELIHIKRNDYLVNIMQAFMEAIYFFNPFVWMISGIIRREREHCCDAVVKSNGNPLAYVRALATLEETRFSKSVLALSFAEDKNQLLNRIKRIMEKSVKNYSGRERIIPFALLIIGLICASWLTIHTRASNGNTTMKPITPTILNDTTGRKKFSRAPKEVITLEQEVKPVVEVVKEVEVNDELNLAVPPVPSIPDIDIVTSPVALRDVNDMNFNVAIPHDIQVPRINPVFPTYFKMDTIPGDWVSRDWDEFSKEFEKKFADKFGDFYKDHQKELEGILDELEHKFDHHFDDELAARMDDMARSQERIALINKIEIKDKSEKQEKAMEEAMKRAEMDMKRMEQENERQLQMLDENVKAMERSMNSFQKELRDQLIKDGYLEADEKVHSIEVTDERIRINKKEIKPSDHKKYQKLFEKLSHGPTEPKRKPYHSTPGRKE